MEEAGPEYFSGVDYRMTILPKKLKEGGYESYAIGKWHGGDASVHLTPKARGFDHHFGFLSGGQDHETQGEYCAATTRGAWTPGAVEPCIDLWRDDGPAYGENGTYSAFLYTHEALRNIGTHDLSTPMFMYLVRCPCLRMVDRDRMRLTLCGCSCRCCAGLPEHALSAPGASLVRGCCH